MAQTSVDIPQLKFNKMSTAKYNELKKAGQLVENEFYITPDGGTIPEVNTDTNQQILSNDGTNLIWRNEQVGYKQITNCITEIPQDIKLELVDGTLTLKAGSKVYVPNGKNADDSNKFDEVVIENDLTGGSAYLNDKIVIFVKADGTGLTYRTVSTCESGSSHSLTSFYNWYDTTNNKIGSYDGNGELEYYCSLPVGVMIDSTSGIVSIDQVFNGFGYIGSTVFAVPDVKGLIPNGRNEDGSLKNIEFTTTSVKIYTSPTNYTFSNFGWVCDPVGNIIPYDLTYYVHREDENYNYELYNNTIHKSSLIAYGSVNAGKTTSFTPKTAFHAVDRNDSSWMSGLGMPSNRYIDLTIGASPTQFTAPANGWFNVWAKGSTTSNNKYLEIINNTTGIAQGVYGTSNFHYKCHLPARKGDKITVQYNNMESAPDRCRFVYAEGEN